MVRGTFPQIEDVSFEENDQRLKVVMPVARNGLFLGLYTILLLAWVGTTVWLLTLLFDISIRQLPTAFLLIWILILLVWGYIWWRLGRHVWRWWQYYAATREILFIREDVLILRRPLSLLGVTDAYDMKHVSPYYYNQKQDAIAFDYGSRAAFFGHALPREDAVQLVIALNERFFPDATEGEGS